VRVTQQSIEVGEHEADERLAAGGKDARREALARGAQREREVKRGYAALAVALEGTPQADVDGSLQRRKALGVDAHRQGHLAAVDGFVGPERLAQHLLGLATAVLIYALLIHFGSRRWVAALACVPVLFDPLQLDIEQYVLTDVSATFLLTAALVVLVWKRGEIGRAAPVIAGLLLAAATDIRQSDLIVIIPAVVYLVAAVRPWRRLAVRASLLIAGFLLPVLGYLGWFQVTRGQFDFVSYNGEFMYGRIAQFIDCTGVPMPAYERHLCPQQPPAQRNLDFYMWAPQSPQVTLKAPPGMSKDDIVIDFDRRIIEHQPLAYLEVIAGDVLYSFSPVRGAGPEQYPIWYHQFHPYYPVNVGALATLRTAGHTGPSVEPALAGFLSGYGRDFYVPGPLLLTEQLIEPFQAHH